MKSPCRRARAHRRRARGRRSSSWRRPRPGRGARAPACERGLPLRLQRDRRHGGDAVAPPCSGTRARGSSRPSGPGVTRVAAGDHVALSWSPSCGACAECVRDLPQLCSTAWPAMGTGGLIDGTTRLSRDGEPVYHYSFLSTFAEACVVPERSLRPDPERRPVRRRRPRRLRRDDRRRRRLAHGGRAAGRPRRGRRLRRRRPVGAAGAVAVGAEPVIAVDVDGRASSTPRGSFGATHGVSWAGVARGDGGGRREASGRRRRLRDRGDRPARGDARGVPLDARARRRRADRHPARGRGALAARAVDPAHGAARARLDLRLVAARARLPAHRSTSTGAGGCRSTGSSRTGCRSTASRRRSTLMRSGEALRVVLDLTT